MEEKQHFSIRKLTIGAASVLIGTTFYLTSSSAVKADTVSDQQDQTEQVVSSGDQNNQSEMMPQTQAASDQDLTSGSVSSSQATSESVSSSQAVAVQKPKTLIASKTDTAQPKDAEANVIYNGNDTSVAQGDWFKIHVASGNLTDVHQGDTYSVQIGQNLPLNYDHSQITTPDFNVTNNGDGTFDLTAKSDYTTANFDIIASMSYTTPLTSSGTINIPVTVSHNSQVLKSMNVPVAMTPAPEQPSEATHPVLWYKCYGQYENTDEIAWGVYINYTEQEMKDLDVTATFGGDQSLIIKDINVFLPKDITQGTKQDQYPNDTYSYSLSQSVQASSTPNKLHLDDSNIKGYSNKPIYIYFRTQVPSYDQKDPNKYTSSINLSANGITPVNIVANPSSSGNSGNSDGTNIPQKVTDSRTVTETINYLEKGTNDVLHAPHTASVTFTRNGEKDPVSGTVTWGDWSADQTFDAVDSPVIAGYTTDTKTVASQTVNATHDSIVINVYYTKDQPQKGQNGPDEVTPDKTLDYQSVTEIIHYVYRDSGKTAAPDNKQSIEFTRVGVDNGDGKGIVWGAWTPANGQFKDVTSPVISGYTASQDIVKGQGVKPGDKNIEVTVYYDKQVTPNVPATGGDVPEIPTTPNTPPTTPNTPPTTPTVPSTGGDIPNKPNKSVGVYTQDSGTYGDFGSPRMRQDQGTNNAISTDKQDKTLPQTGTKNNFGLALGTLISALGLFGISLTRKRRN